MHTHREIINEQDMVVCVYQVDTKNYFGATKTHKVDPIQVSHIMPTLHQR